MYNLENIQQHPDKDYLILDNCPVFTFGTEENPIKFNKFVDEDRSFFYLILENDQHCEEMKDIKNIENTIQEYLELL